MPTATKQFSFNANLEGWVFNAGGGTGVAGTRDTAEDSPNDINSGAGVMQTRRAGKNLTNGVPYWEWIGNWGALGVPMGSIVTRINLNYDWRCSEYITGSSTSSIGPVELRDSAYNFLWTFSIAHAATAITSWATRSGTAFGLNDAFNTSIRLRITGRPNTGNSSSAAVTLRMDWVVVTITYTTPTIHALAGTASGASLGAGQIAAIFSLSGNIAGSSSAVGNLSATWSITDQSQGVSSVAGGIALLTLLAGQAVAISIGTADLLRNRTLAGGAIVWSSGMGTLRFTWSLGGASGGVSSGTGVMTALRRLTNQSDARAFASGTLLLQHALTGIADIFSIAIGDLVVRRTSFTACTWPGGASAPGVHRRAKPWEKPKKFHYSSH